MKWAAFLLTLMLPFCGFAETQEPSAAALSPTPFKISVDSRLVLRAVSVKDSEGNPVEGLTEQDFIITEDGAPQTVAVCEPQKFNNDPLPPMQPSSITGRHAASISMAGKKQFASAGPGKVIYQDRRLLALYFDLMTMPTADRHRALAAGRNFIQNRMTSPDLMAIMAFSKGAVRVLADFTDDRQKLDSAIQALMRTDNQDENFSGADTAAAFGQNADEFNLFNSDRRLAALQTAVKMLGGLSERKSFVYFASGMRLNAMENLAQLRATINAAVRAGVVFYPVDARGLAAEAPLGDATQPSPGGIDIFTGAAAMARREEFQESQDTLFALASNTGGKATLDYNDLSRGIEAAQTAVSSYYILGYYPANTAADGKFHRINIELAGKQRAELDYRQGYYAENTFRKFTEADKERQLEEALMLEDPITDIPLAMEVNYFKLNSAEYFTPVTVMIPGSELLYARDAGASRTVIDFIGEIRDEYGTVYSNMRDKVSFKLKGETLEALSRRRIEFDCGFTLLPGKYLIKVLARNAETGRIGTYMTAFTIPNLMKEQKRLPISSVVLSSQSVAMKNALFTAGKDKAQAANPLVVDGRKLVPSVSRVFDRKREMQIYLQAYENSAVSTEPLVVFATFFRGGAKTFETPALSVVEGLNAKSKAVPIRFSVELSKLPSGEYVCQVTVLDPANRKAAFWQAPVMLIQ